MCRHGLSSLRPWRLMEGWNGQLERKDEVTIKAVVIGDSEYEQIQLRDLKHMQGVVGGYIEAVGEGDYTLWVNEEGKLQGLPVNQLGTDVWWALMPRMYGKDVLCGMVLVTGGAGDDGETLPITDRVEQVIQRIHERTIG